MLTYRLTHISSLLEMISNLRGMSFTSHSTKTAHLINLLDSTEETKPNTTKVNIRPEQKNIKHKINGQKTKARFGCLLRPPALVKGR